MINLFIDTNIHYGLLDNLYANLFKLNNINRLINIIDKDNNHIQVTQSYYSEMGPQCIRLTMYFEILINYSNQLLIEGEWDKTFDDIPEKIVEWYTNPMNKSNLPRLDEVTLKQCKKNISIIEENIKNKEYGSFKILIKWQKKLETTILLGNYKSINKSSRIFVQADIKTSIISYLSVLDKISQGLTELRNELCLKKFNLEYNKLDLTKYKDNKIKRAIDEVYPVMINPITYYPNVIPPPPPNNIN